MQVIPYQCSSCGMQFDDQKHLSRHMDKFCMGSIYDPQTLLKTSQPLKNKQLKQKLVLKASTVSELSAQMQEMKRIERKRLEESRVRAMRQLEAVQLEEQKLMFTVKQTDLEVLQKKKKKIDEEEFNLIKEITQLDQHAVQRLRTEAAAQNKQFKKGVAVGKSILQKQLLEEKKRYIEHEILAKHRLYNTLEREMVERDREEEKIENTPQKKQVEVQTQSLQNNGSEGNDTFRFAGSRILKMSEPIEEKKHERQTAQIQSRLFPESATKNEQYQTFLQATVNKVIGKPVISHLLPNTITASTSKLSANINPEGKAGEDIFLEFLMAQQFDELEFISKLPKNSPLYLVKLEQFKEMSIVRDELREKVHGQRIEKFQKYLAFDKAIAEDKKNNQNWASDKRLGILQGKVTKSGPNFLSGDNVSEPQQQGTMIQRAAKIDAPRLTMPNGIFYYQINFRKVVNYRRPKYLTVKLVVVSEQHDSRFPITFNTTYHHEEAEAAADQYHPAVSNKFNSSNEVVFDQIYNLPDLRAIYRNNHADLFLYVMLIEKENAKMIKTSNEGTTYGWYCFKLTHFNRIREGTFVLNLFDDQCPFPDPADMNKVKNQLEEEFVIDLKFCQVENRQEQKQNKGKNINNLSNLSPIMPNNEGQQSQVKSVQHRNNQSQIAAPSSKAIQNYSKMKDNGTQQAASQKNRGKTPQEDSKNGQKLETDGNLKTKTRTSLKAEPEEGVPFLKNKAQIRFAVTKSYKQQLNFDLKIGNVRLVPSYVGPLHMEVCFIDSEGYEPIPRETALVELQGNLHNQHFNYRLQVRKKQLTSSTVIFIRLVSFCTLNHQNYTLGFTLLHLFYGKDGSELAIPKATDYLMATGCFQMPIRWNLTKPKFLRLQQLQETSAQIPGASILISVDVNESNDSSPMPPYSSNLYNTIFIELNPQIMKTITDQWQRQPADLKMHLKSYLKFKGFKKGIESPEVVNYLTGLLAFNNENGSHLQDLSFMAEYKQQRGLIFTIDKLILRRDSGDYYYFFTLCAIPPGNYYHQKEMDLVFFYQFNAQISHINELYLNLRDAKTNFLTPADRNACFIIQINRIKLSGSKIASKAVVESFRHCIIPIFKVINNVICLNTGQHQMILGQGDFQAKEIEGIDTNLEEYLRTNDKSTKTEEKLLLRISHSFFPNQFLQNTVNLLQPKRNRRFDEQMGNAKLTESIRRFIEHAFETKVS